VFGCRFFILLGIFALSLANGSSGNAEDLVPTKPGTAPNYWSTWAVQNSLAGIGSKSGDAKKMEGSDGSQQARTAMTETNVFGPDGWVTTFFPTIRSDLYVAYDDGLFRDGTGSFQIDEKKFPFVAGLDADERMSKLNDRTRDAGWRGAALWCRAPETNGEVARNFVLWSRHAGIDYWKIDGGDDNLALVGIAKSLDPSLKLEHIQGGGLFNENSRYGRVEPGSLEAQCLEHADVFRTGDASSVLSLPTTLDRITAALKYGNEHTLHSLINCEDEVYLAATLGCTMGIRRHPLTNLPSATGSDDALNSPRQCNHRLDEVVRALRWQRIGHPFVRFTYDPHPEDATQTDEKTLYDVWTFQTGEISEADAIGKTVTQGAPARVSRGLPLPEVTSDHDSPFVIAGRFPNSAVAVATQGRTFQGKNWIFPPADVSLDVGTSRGPFGIFGHYRSLTLRFLLPVGTVRILAQDLAGGNATDITSQVIIKDNTLTLPGALIDKVGLSAATPGDLSDPGMVLVIR
jgi:hypothetical protein